MTLKLDKIVDEMGKDWVKKTRRESRAIYHAEGIKAPRQFEMEYIRRQYNKERERC